MKDFFKQLPADCHLPPLLLLRVRYQALPYLKRDVPFVPYNFRADLYQLRKQNSQRLMFDFQG